MDDAATTGPWFMRWRVELLLVAACLLAGAYCTPRMDYDNSSSRYFALSAVVDYHTLSIDAYAKYTIDTSTGADGHTYTNKGIGSLLVGLPAYWLARQLPVLARQPAINTTARYLVRLWAATLPLALGALLLYRLALRWQASRRGALLGALAWGLGSVAWVHATQYSGHILTAVSLLAALWLLERARTSPHAAVLAGGAGLLAGLATLSEFTVAFVALVMTLYVARRRQWRLTLAFVAGGAAMAGLLGLYNWHCFGAPWQLSYSNLADPGFRADTAKGMLGIQWPRPAILWALLGGPARGLFAISPVMVLALPGWWRLWRDSARLPEALLLLAGCAVIVLPIAGYFGWHGGWIYGSRYLVSILPFVALAVACSPASGALGWALLTLSILQVGTAVATCIYPTETIRNPLVELCLPLWQMGYRPTDWGLGLGLPPGWSLLPLAVALLVATFLLARWTHDAAPASSLPRPWRLVLAAWLAIVLAMLAFLRTTPPAQAYHDRARLLQGYIKVTGDQALLPAARAEYLRWVELTTPPPEAEPPP